MTKHAKLLSEVLRPQDLCDLTLPKHDIDRLGKMVASGSVMNMMFYGKPGLGKTSAARAIIKLINADACEINGSKATGVDFVRDRIEAFASTVPMFGSVKICFIDEADYLSKNSQAALRHTIERTSINCRFLFTVNDLRKMIPAIQSRLLKIGFDISIADRAEVQERLLVRYERTLSKAGIQYDETRLREIIGIYFPDLRTIANHLEWEFA